MSYVRSRTFLCCLPVRFGVFVMVLFGLLGGILVSTVGIIQLKNHQIGGYAPILSVIMYLILAIVSLFGMVGTIMRRRRLVAVYWALLTAHLAFSILAGVFSLVTIYKNAPANLNACINGSKSQSVIGNCQDAEKMAKGITTALYIIIWLGQIYGIVIVDRYCKQLADEEDASFKTMDNEGARPTW